LHNVALKPKDDWNYNKKKTLGIYTVFRVLSLAKAI
jgi:hypothetical protein